MGNLLCKMEILRSSGGEYHLKERKRHEAINSKLLEKATGALQTGQTRRGRGSCLKALRSSGVNSHHRPILRRRGKFRNLPGWLNRHKGSARKTTPARGASNRPKHRHSLGRQSLAFTKRAGAIEKRGGAEVMTIGRDKTQNGGVAKEIVRKAQE